MQTTSATWKSLWQSGGAWLDVRAVIDGVEYTRMSNPVIARALTQGGLSVGNAVSAMCRFSVLTANAIPRAAVAVVQMRLTDGTTSSEWLSAGTYYIAHRTRDAVTGLLTLECYDALLKANAVWEPSGGAWPRSMSAVVTELLALLDVSLDSRTTIREGAAYVVGPPDAGTTIHDVLGRIAAANGGNWIVTPAGRLRLVPVISAAGAEHAERDVIDVLGVTDVASMAGSVTVQSTGTITGVRYPADGAAMLLGDDSGIVVDADVGAAIAQDVYDALEGMTYQAFALNGAIYDPAAELGDYVRGGANGEASGVLYSETATLGLAFRGDIGAPEPGEMYDEYPYIGANARTLTAAKVYAAQQVAALNDSLDQQDVFNRLTNNGQVQGLILYDGQLYINAGYINAGTLSADRIAAGTIALSKLSGAAQGALVGASTAKQQYYLSTSSSSATGGSWQDAVPAWSSGKYVWTRVATTVTKADGTSTSTSYSTAVYDANLTTALSTASTALSDAATAQTTANGAVGSASVKTQYYLSTSSSSATGGSWQDAMPAWSSGKYVWTRVATTTTPVSGSASTSFRPSASGMYDANLTTALSTASTALSDAATAQTTANGANAREQTIYISKASGTTSVSANTTWVTSNSNTQNAWTTVRPTYNSSYPVLFVATQRQTVSQSSGTTCSCTTPVIDQTTTVIDGGHITTGTIDAGVVSVTNLNAGNITGGTLSADRIAANSIAVAKLTGSISGGISNSWVLNLTNGTLTIGNISAANITTGTLSADRIAANSIAVSKLTGSISGGISNSWVLNLTNGTLTIGNISASNITAGTLSANRIDLGEYVSPFAIPDEYKSSTLFSGQSIDSNGWIVQSGGEITILKLQSAADYRGKTFTVACMTKSYVSGGTWSYSTGSGAVSETWEYPANGHLNSTGALDGGTNEGAYYRFSKQFTVPQNANSVSVVISTSGVKSIQASFDSEAAYGVSYGSNINLGYKGLQVGRFVVDKSGNVSMNGDIRGAVSSKISASSVNTSYYTSNRTNVANSIIKIGNLVFVQLDVEYGINIPTNTTFAEVPSGYRPKSAVTVPAMLHHATADSWNGYAVKIGTNGAIQQVWSSSMNRIQLTCCYETQ